MDMIVQVYLHCFPLHWCPCAWCWPCGLQGPSAGLCSGCEKSSLVWRWYWAPARWSTGPPSEHPSPLFLPGSMPLHRAKKGCGCVYFFSWTATMLLLYWLEHWMKRWGLTIYVIHGKAVGEVGHVCLLPKRRLLQCLLWPAIIQTLHHTHTHTHV